MNETLRFPKVSVIVVNFNGKKHLEKCFSCLDKLDYPKEKTELIMVDNGSTDGSIEYMEKSFPGAIILKNDVNNYCMSNNLGIKKSSGEYVALLNNDTQVDKNWLKELIKVTTSDGRIGAAGSRILFEDGRLQSTGHVEFPYYYFGDRGFLEEDVHKYDTVQEVHSISNCSALYRRRALDEAGLLDEDFVMYMEDVDLCFRLIKNKWKVLYVPESRVYHKMHGSIEYWKERSFNIEKNRLLFIAKHFPEKLSANIIGYGNICSLEPKFFHVLLLDIFNKLIEHHGSKKALKIFMELTENIKKMSDYSQHVLRETERNARIKDEESAAKSKEVQDLNSEINRLKIVLVNNEKDTQSLKAMLEGKHRELSDFKKLHEDFAMQVDAETRRLDAEINTKDARIKQQEEFIAKKDRELDDFNSKIRALEDRARLLEKEAGSRDEKIVLLQNLINKKDKESSSLEGELNKQGSYLAELKNRIEAETTNLKNKEEELQKFRNEIANIYNSETYRLVVRPIVWPFFSLLKNIVKLYRLLYNKKIFYKQQKNLCIAQLYAKNIEAKYLQENEYTIKVVNNRFKEEKVKLFLDIWPYYERCHPERHYAYFGTEFVVSPRSTVLCSVIYNWEKNTHFFIDKEERLIIDFWRGKMKSFEIYEIKAVIYNSEGHVIDELTVIQGLKGVKG